MAPLDLDGRNLGEKHRNYNLLLSEALKSNKEPQPIDYSQDDNIQNLINIDIACKTRNVDYILEVLKCEHDLYYSKAIKRSTWLITDSKYQHIINPQYLFDELFPQMTMKAFNKLLLSVRLNLKDENRVEDFYNYINKKDLHSSHKWLQNCSIPFIERVIKDDYINNSIVKRLFKKSYYAFEATVRKFGYDRYKYSVNLSDNFLIKYPERVMDFIENVIRTEYYVIGPRGTKFLMKKYPDRILQNIPIYGRKMHIATFAKMLKHVVDVEEFLVQNSNFMNERWMYKNEKIKHFIQNMTEEKRFEFVKKVFINKDFEEGSVYQKIAGFVSDQRNKRLKNNETYVWYRYAPFDVAYGELIALVRAESMPVVRSCMLQFLLSCAGANMDHIRRVFQYYHDRHMNEPFKFKVQFVNQFISSVDIHSLDDQTWDTLCKLFHSMEVYIESENDVQFCVRAIIVRCAVRNEPVPEIIERKFLFDTLKNVAPKLKTREEKDALFNYLQNFIVKQGVELDLEHEPDFDHAVHLCEKNLEIINDWGRHIQDYPAALARVKQLAEFKMRMQWNRDLTWLYNLNKSWRKLLFAESIVIMQNENVCVNALKHDPVLLSTNKTYLLTLSSTDSVSLKNFLRKIRIYWPRTLAEDWRTIYTNRINNDKCQKALVNGLCALFSQEQVSDLLKKYAPSDSKVVWNDQVYIELSLRKQIAIRIHQARPLPQVDDLLLYAKGDYLQYVVPSISAVLSQLSPNKCRKYIPRLLDAPVSLKKFGIRCAINKMPPTEIKPMLSEIWNTTKSTALRTVVFTHTHRLLRVGDVKTFSETKDTWNLLSTFMDTLTPKDNKLVFEKVGEFYLMPASIQPEYFMKGYKLISSLPAKCECIDILHRMEYSAGDYIQHFDDEFFIQIFMKNFEDGFDGSNIDKYLLIPAFILVAKDEEMQMKRYEKTLKILLEEHLPKWDEAADIKNRIKKVLLKFVTEIKEYAFVKKSVIPLKIYERLFATLEKALSYKKHYAYLTTWKLVIAILKMFKDNKSTIDTYEKQDDDEADKNEFEKMLHVLHDNIAPEITKYITTVLNEDMAQFGKSIWSLLAIAMRSCLCDYVGTELCESRHRVLYSKHLLLYSNETELQLLVLHMFQDDINSYSRFGHEKYELYKEIHDAISKGSDEVKMHFYDSFLEVGLPIIL